MNLTPAQVKNLMRRGLRFIVDPEPTKDDKRLVRNHFVNHCAYCGTPIDSNGGDIDHLVSAALGGANGLANRVLSCKLCNAVEKRDRDWLEFLREKAQTPEIFDHRKRTIERWVEINGGHLRLDPTLSATLQNEERATTDYYDRACKRIKVMKSIRVIRRIRGRSS